MTTKQEADSPEEIPTIATWKILVAILFLGVAIYAIVTVSSEPDTFSINGFEFVETICQGTTITCYETRVYTNVGVVKASFFTDPREVDEVYIDPVAVEAILNLSRMQNSSLALSFDEGSPAEIAQGMALLARVTGERVYRINTFGAVYNQDVTCSMSTPLNRVAYYVQRNLNAVIMQDECILIAAEHKDSVVTVVDTFVLHLLQIL